MKAKTITIFLVATILVIQTLAIAKIYRENRQLSDNFAAVVRGTEFYRINDSISAARSYRLLLDNAEIKAQFPEIKSAIRQMDVKLRQLERYSAINSTANYEIVTKIYQDLQDLQDYQDFSVVSQSPQSSPVSPLSQSSQVSPVSPVSPPQYTHYKDRWLTFQQAIIADSAYTSIQTKDSIAIVQSWERSRKFLFVPFGRKRHIQTVTNANPHATITYSIFVDKNN
jgi:hypothetical protein